MLSKYEQEIVNDIRTWKNEEPSIVSQTFGKLLSPVARLVNMIVPDAAIQGALEISNNIGEWLADTSDIRRDGGVEMISEFKNKDIELSDRLANDVQNWAIAIAAGEGTVAGFFGVFGMVADFPTLITLALRTIHKIGLCYGYEAFTEDDKNFVLGILSASGANSMEEKLAALTLLRTIEVTIAKTTWKEMAKLAAARGGQQMLNKEGVILAIRNLAKQLGVNLTKRKASQVIPVIGAFIGGGINGWFINDVAWAARRTFQERWLIDNQKVLEI